MDEKEKDLQEQVTPEAEPTQGGRRLDQGRGLSRKGKIAIAAGALAVALLAGGYLGLCAYASGDRVIPGVRAGEVDLSGLTAQEASQAMAGIAQSRYEELEIPIQVQDKTVTFSAKQAGVTVTGDGESAVRAGKGHFLTSGWNYLAGLMGRTTPLNYTVNVGDSDYVTRTLASVAEAVGQPVEDPHWELEETEETATLTLYRGKTGQRVDAQAVYDALLDALSRGDSQPIQVEVTSTAPGEPDLAALAGEIDREPVDASLDLDTTEVIPHKLGLKVDPDRAAALFAAMAEGESRTLDLEVTQPQVTTLALRSTLFQDILGEGTSRVSGTANRIGNVTLASAACNGVILLPGEVFSYNQTTGQRTREKGYREASGYATDGVVDMVGGGVCQPSSTLYMACLKANLEIVSRTNHYFTVSYMPEGIDAQVSWPGMDYKFANNTPYPIKIEMTVADRVCTARIYGTKTDDNYVELESVRLGTTNPETIYRADESVPQGTTRVVNVPFTGRSVEVYKKTFSADGTLLSRTLVNRSYYNKNDRVIAYNPADGAPDGSVLPVDPDTGLTLDPETGLPIDPETGEPLVGPEDQPPVETAEPSGEPAAEPSGEPAAEPSGEPSVEPSAEPSTEPSAEPSAEPAPPPEEPAPAPAEGSGYEGIFID